MGKRMGVFVLTGILLTGCSLQNGESARIKGTIDFTVDKDGKQGGEETETAKITEATKTAEIHTEARETEKPEDKNAATEKRASESITPETDVVEDTYQNTAGTTKKALFRDTDGTIHGPQIGLTEHGSPLYDYDIDPDTIPEEWKYGNFTYSAGTEAYMTENGELLYRDPDGTIHGPQIGLTENGSPLYDYDFDPAIIPEEWQYTG